MKNRLLMTALAIAAMGVLAGGEARAQTSPSAGFEHRYGTAGCGLGSMLFGTKPGIIQVFAATTNAVFGQTFAITSGTSNCGEGVSPIASTKNFVETNRAVVAKDIARGQGETIATLSTLAGCRSSDAVATSLQRNFGRIFPDPAIADGQVARNVVSVLQSDQTLACSKL